MSRGMDSKAIANIFLGTSVALLSLDIMVNYRLWSQVNEVYLVTGGFGTILSTFTQAIIALFSFIGIEWSLLMLKAFCVFCFAVYVFVGRPSVSDERPGAIVYLILFGSTAGYFINFFFSPYYYIVKEQPFSNAFAACSLLVTLIIYLAISYSYGRVGRWFVYGGSSGLKGDAEEDPFGREQRRFNQTTEKIENEFSVNIPYTFINPEGKKTNGWINFINVFRAVQILGTPGSGKTYTFFLAAIQQLIKKGFTMVIYDFKYKDLSEYAYNCLQASKEAIKKKMNGLIPQFCVITFDNVFESERCNVIQPNLLNDFTIDAYGVSNIFLTALNRTWTNKEGDFFPESAKNFVAASTWALKRYKGGRNCSIPHLIEFVSQETEEIIKCLIALKDNSLSNVIKPFEDAYNNNATDQLQGQMGTVRIAMSRLSSPIVYWILTEDPTAVPFSLEVNNKKNPKILCLGSSGKNQMVNNIFHSLFISQIFRLVNVKGRWPLGVMLDEVVTLSFPKGTLDTLIATARSNMVSVWMGFQDLSQLIRDFTKDVAEALFKMVGNTVSGNVEDDTAKRVSDRIGKMRYIKKSMSVSAEGQASFSFSEAESEAVPPNFLSSLSQGQFAGKLADDFGQPLETKVFYGESAYQPPFQGKENIPHRIPMTVFWETLFETECKNMNEEERKAYADELMQRNFESVRDDIKRMREDLLSSAA